MKEKDLADKTATTEKTKESDFAINYDRICLQQDRQDRINKEKYLQQFRNENKRVIILYFINHLFCFSFVVTVEFRYFRPAGNQLKCFVIPGVWRYPG